MGLSKFTDYYKKFEKYISPIGLIYGFIFTSLTLTRVDMFIENFWIVLHLLVVCSGILAITFYENRAEKKHVPEAERVKFHFYLTLVIQFAFGGLFSTFFVFYMRSSSLVDSWLFVAMLLGLVIGNELWKKHYQRLAFQVSILFISIYLFLIFLLPVLAHRLGADLFLASGIISLLITFFFTYLIRKFAHEKFTKSHNYIKISIASIFVLMNLLYFADIIPPIPLALKEAGVFHNVVRTNNGYLAQAEPSNWSAYFTLYPVFHAVPGDTVYVFSSIFSPVAFEAQIIHQWQYYDEAKKWWVDSNRVTLPIVGGRTEGYRTYSLKQGATVGKWRVKVITASGQTLGQVNFKVENSTSTPALIEKVL